MWCGYPSVEKYIYIHIYIYIHNIITYTKNEKIRKLLRMDFSAPNGYPKYPTSKFVWIYASVFCVKMLSGVVLPTWANRACKSIREKSIRASRIPLRMDLHFGGIANMGRQMNDNKPMNTNVPKRGGHKWVTKTCNVRFDAKMRSLGRWKPSSPHQRR